MLGSSAALRGGRGVDVTLDAIMAVGGEKEKGPTCDPEVAKGKKGVVKGKKSFMKGGYRGAMGLRHATHPS